MMYDPSVQHLLAIGRVQKQTDGAGMHKRPEDRMWLPKGGQIGNSRSQTYFIENATSKQGRCIYNFIVIIFRSPHNTMI